MDGKQRTLTALARGIPDRVPMWDWFDEAVLLGVGQRLGLVAKSETTVLRRGDETDASIDLYASVIEAIEVDASSLVYGTGFAAIDADYGRGRYGRTFLLSEHGEPAIWEGAAHSAEEARRYDMAGRIEDADFDGVRRLIRRLPDRAHALNIEGPFAEAWMMMGGMDKLMLAFVEDPGYAHAALRTVTEFSKVLIYTAADLGIDFIMVDGDLCGNDFTRMSYADFREFLYPYKKEFVDHAHGRGLKIVKHCDGNVWRLLDDFIELGFDGFHPVQPQCMDLAQVKAHLFGRIRVFGNVECLDLLVFGTPEQVEVAAQQVIADGAPGGGYVFASSNSLHPGFKPENVIAMFEAGRRYGDYAGIAPKPRAVAPPPDTTPVRQPSRRRRADPGEPAAAGSPTLVAS